MKKYLRKRVESFKHAFNGIYLLKNEAHIIVHICIAIVTIIIGFIQNLSSSEWYIIILCIALVLVAEIFNTAIEKTVDYISLEKHPKAKIIKDISAAAVLLATIFSAIIGTWILFF